MATETAGFVLRCAHDGALREVIFVAPELAELLEEAWPGRLAPDHQAALRQFLDEAAGRPAVFGRNIQMGPRALVLSSVREPAGLLVIATQPPEEELHRQLNALSALNNEIVNRQRRLTKDNSLLTVSSRQKDRMLSHAAHDLRNPLGFIVSFSEILEQEVAALTPEQREMLGVIRESAEQLLRIVSDVLDVAQYRHGALVLKREPVRVEEVVGQALKLIKPLADQKGVLLALEPAHTIAPPAHLDPVKIAQVIHNLATNAVKFSPAGSRVTLRVSHGSDEVEIAVQDQGQGIPAAELPKLFTLFGTTSVRATDGRAGSGLGLALSRAIVEAHGGSIRVASEVGRGSTFSVRLPRAGGG